MGELEPIRWRTWPLSWGFGTSVGLVTALTLLTVSELGRATRITTDLVTRAERSTYEVAAVGRQFARLRARLYEVMTDGVVSPADQERLRQLTLQLDQSLALLPQVLSPAERAFWEAKVLPEVTRSRRLFEQSQRLLLAGRLEEADALVDELSTASITVQAGIDELTAMNQAETRRLHESMALELRRVRALEAILGALGIAIAVAVWLAVTRVVRRQQARLDAQLRTLEARNDDLDAFAGRVAHDLHGILAPLPLTAHALRRVAGDEGPLLEHAARLERLSARSALLLDGLLAFARAGDGTGAGSVAPVSEAISAALEELAGSVEEGGVRLRTQVPSNLAVRCPPGLLHVVVRNLVGNAVKFVKEGERRQVDVEAAREGDGVRLRVSDTGPGIPQEAQPRLFEPFYRVPGTREPGTGLGLATVRRVVDSHRGRVEVRSTVGEGTTFEVWLPSAGPPG